MQILGKSEMRKIRELIRNLKKYNFFDKKDKIQLQHLWFFQKILRKYKR